MRINVNESLIHYLLHAPYNPILQHHLNPSRVIGSGREDTRNYPFGEFPTPLVLFLDDLHAHSNF
jgi:hypothetical protein